MSLDEAIPVGDLMRNRENDAVRDKREKAIVIPLMISDAEAVQEVAKKLISKFHHELGSANFIYLYRSKSAKSGGKPIPGHVKKASPIDKHVSRSYFEGLGKTSDNDSGEADYIMTIALDVWNDLQPSQRMALVDHLLTRCVGAEDEKTGEMKFTIQAPNVHEFSTIVERHGQWNDDLVELARCIK